MVIYDSWKKEFKSTFGALRRDAPCRFSIKIPKNLTLDFPPVMVVFRTGFKERFVNMSKIGEEGDYSVYSVTFAAKYAGVHYYYFSYFANGTRYYIKKKDCHYGTLGDGELFQLTVYSKRYHSPSFLKGGVMYQIFPDRFCKSGKEHKDIPSGRILRDDWGGTPYYKPDENGHVWNNDYFGGDLEGIRSKLGYLSDLGVTCIYLNPIFESHENHRYNTANYMKVDPLLGTNEDFKALCEDAEKYGISVVLDGVFSHTGADSIYFNKFGRYDTVGAYNSKDSEYYDWYTFYNYPDEYEAWWGIDTLPNVVENNENYTKYICGENGVLDYWISLGAAGFRLDVADELPDQFLENLNECVKRNGEEKIVIGEVWEDASNKESYGVKRRYLLGKQLDSVMNYPFRQAIIDYVMGGSPRTFEHSIMTILENYPKQIADVLMNFVSTHDIERAINRFGGDNCDGQSKDWMAERYLTPEQYDKGKNMLKVAMALMFFVVGVPSIYYGDEAGLQGYKDPFNRRCYPWGNEDTELIAFTKELSKVRKSSTAFVDGEMRFICKEKNYVGFVRSSDDETMLIFVNRSDSECVVDSFPSYVKEFSGTEAVHGELSDCGLKIKPFDYAVIKCIK